MVSLDLAHMATSKFWLPAAAFALATSISPGPVNVIAAASGANFGLAKTMPQVLGATLGFSALLLGMGVGLRDLLLQFAWLHWILKLTAACFLGYLALSMFMARPGTGVGMLQRPLHLFEGVLSQWTNPKAWVVAATGIGTYTLQGQAYFASVFVLSSIFAVVCFPSIGIWAAIGHSATNLLASTNAMRWFNRLMGALLLASVVAVLIG